MPTLKAQFDESAARALLGTRFGAVTELTALRGGEVSQAFAFVADGRALVLRVNTHTDYGADAWVWRLTRDTAIPVPEVLATGRAGDLHWAVSARVPGRTLQADPAAVPALVPDLVATLRQIHALPTTGDWFGYAAARDARRYPTWRAFVIEEEARGTLIDWPRVLAEASATERATIERCWARAEELLPHLPERRALLHGDYSLDNILADAGRISGVIDWSSCCYGDPLRDVAWVEFWAPQLGFAAAYLAAGPPAALPAEPPAALPAEPSEPDAAARLACYRACIAARALGFYLHFGQREAAGWVVEVVSRKS